MSENCLVVWGKKHTHSSWCQNHYLASSKSDQWGTSLAVQWLRLHASNAGDAGSIPGLGTKILHTTQHGQKKKSEQWDRFAVII